MSGQSLTKSLWLVQSSQRTSLPGLQDLKGQWSGGVQAYGGGGGATNVDFNVRGQSWQWGDYALDQARPAPAMLLGSSCMRSGSNTTRLWTVWR